MKHSPDALCYCGSSLPYRFCHQAIDKAGPQHRVGASREKYDEAWTENARHFENQGCYEWMADQLSAFEPQRVLDIGCGDGRGILALIRRYAAKEFEIFSVEENPSCIQRTRRFLARNKVSSSVIRRCEVIVRAPNTHAITTYEGRLKAQRGVNLFEGDILADTEIDEYLASLPRFDALTVWLLGTHPVRYECYNLHELAINNSTDYRMLVHSKAYSLADQILRPGGVLHFVDRGELLTPELRNNCLEMHRSLALQMRTALTVQQVIECKDYTEPTSVIRTPMFTAPNVDGKKADFSRLCMRSVFAIK